MVVAIKPHFENMFLVLLDCMFAYNAKLFEMGPFHERIHDMCRYFYSCYLLQKKEKRWAKIKCGIYMTAHTNDYSIFCPVLYDLGIHEGGNGQSSITN